MQCERTLRPVGIQYHGNFVLFRKYACVKHRSGSEEKNDGQKGEGDKQGV